LSGAVVPKEDHLLPIAHRPTSFVPAPWRFPRQRFETFQVFPDASSPGVVVITERPEKLWRVMQETYPCIVR